MKILKVVALFAVVLLAIGVAVAPIGPMPGFFIGGTEATPPASWPDTSSVHEIKLKVPGTLPRVVVIWVVEHDDELYVVGSRESGWTRMIGASAPVEMRLGDNTYALKATAQTENLEPLLTAYVDKYRPDYPDIVASFPSAEAGKGSFAVFHLGRR